MLVKGATELYMSSFVMEKVLHKRSIEQKDNES